MSVRERSRLRPQLLERLGWRYMPLWTIEVFTDPSTCADRIAGYLGLERVVLPGRGDTSVGFLDDDVDQALNGIQAGEQRSRRSAGVEQNVPGRDQGRLQVQHPDSKEAVHVATEDKNNHPSHESSLAAGAARGDGDVQGQDQNQDQGQDQDQSQDQDRVWSRGKGKDQAGGGVLPTKAAEDDPRRWGDADEDHDAWLKEQKPPHWG
jgi:hypothetical protein